MLWGLSDRINPDKHKELPAPAESDIAILRNARNLSAAFKAKDCGLICTRADLGRLEIIVLEVNSEANHEHDQDIIQVVSEQWFTEMKVKRFGI